MREDALPVPRLNFGAAPCEGRRLGCCKRFRRKGRSQERRRCMRTLEPFQLLLHSLTQPCPGGSLRAWRRTKLEKGCPCKSGHPAPTNRVYSIIVADLPPGPPF